MWRTIVQAIRQPDLRKRFLITLGLLAVYRLVTQIPLSVIDVSQLQKFFANNQIFGLLDIFSGGALSNFSIGLMGVGPYITASIVMQLLTYVIPSLEALQKEGHQGQMAINQYTRLLTIPFGFIQGFGLLAILKSQGVIPGLNPAQLIAALLIATSTTVLLMWLGELITEQGIGNGVSLIITTGILAGIPAQIKNTASIIAGGGIIDTGKLFGIIIFAAIALITVAFIVTINDAIRRIPVSYARRVVGRRSLGGADTYLPIKINSAGVIPIIFALSVIVFPSLITRFIENNAKSQLLITIARAVTNGLNPNGVIYGLIYFFMVVVFTYFYTGVVFKPKDVAENLQKQGGFIPGIRPGNETANFLSSISKRLTLPGSIFLGLIAILPFIIQSVTKINTLVIGGTGVLIIVTVILETANQIKAHILSVSYDRYGS